MTTDRRAATAGRVAAHRRTLVAAGCLLLAAGSCAVWVTRPHWSATGTVLVVANPVYAAASAQAVGPRALTADRGLAVPRGVAVAVEPAPASVLRITVTAPDAVTARAVANRVLDDGLPAALRAQVAEGLKLRRSATAATPKVTPADVDAALEAYGLRIVTVTRASGTTPSGADAVQAVAVAQVGGLPATSPDPQVATRLVAAALDPAALDGLVNGRRAAADLTTPGGPALTVVARSGGQDLAAQVANDVLGAAQTPLTRMLRSSGLPAETLVLQPYVAPVAAPVRVAPPWWLVTLLGLAVAALGAAVTLDRRDRRPGRAAPLAVRPRRAPGTAGPDVAAVAARTEAPRPAPLAPPTVPATLLSASAQSPAAAPQGSAARPWDWSPVRLGEYGGTPAVERPAHDWAGPRAMPPAGPAAEPVAAPVVEPAAEPVAGPVAAQEVPAQEQAPEPMQAAAPVSVVDLRHRIFGDGPDDGDGGVPAQPHDPSPDAGAGRATPDARPRLADLLTSGPLPAGPRADGAADGASPDRGGPAARHGARHGQDGAVPAGVPAPPVMPGARTGSIPPVMPPAMPGAVRPTGDPASFAPPLHSVVVEPAPPSVVRRSDVPQVLPQQQPGPVAGEGLAVPDPAVPVDPRRPWPTQAAVPPPAPGVPAQSSVERPGQTYPAGRPARSVTPFVPPTVAPTGAPGAATQGWRPPVGHEAAPDVPPARPFPAGPVAAGGGAPVPVPLPAPSPDQGRDGDRAWSDILGTGAPEHTDRPARPQRPPKFPRGRR